VDSPGVEVRPEVGKLPLEIRGIPEERSIEQLSPNCSDRAFREGMRNRCIGHQFDLLDFTDPKIGKPSAKPEQRIIIGAHALRKRVVGDGGIEYPGRCLNFCV